MHGDVKSLAQGPPLNQTEAVKRILSGISSHQA